MDKKILIVDDNDDIKFSIQFGLENLDPSIHVISVENGKKCLEYLHENKDTDLILLDIMMPGMNGWQVFKKIRDNEKWNDIPIMFLTAKTDNFSKAFGKIIADSYIEKPFEISDLKDKILDVLSKPNKIPEKKIKIIDDMLQYVDD